MARKTEIQPLLPMDNLLLSPDYKCLRALHWLRSSRYSLQQLALVADADPYRSVHMTMRSLRQQGFLIGTKLTSRGVDAISPLVEPPTPGTILQWLRERLSEPTNLVLDVLLQSPGGLRLPAIAERVRRQGDRRWVIGRLKCLRQVGAVYRPTKSLFLLPDPVITTGIIRQPEDGAAVFDLASVLSLSTSDSRV